MSLYQTCKAYYFVINSVNHDENFRFDYDYWMFLIGTDGGQEIIVLQDRAISVVEILITTVSC